MKRVAPESHRRGVLLRGGLRRQTQRQHPRADLAVTLAVVRDGLSGSRRALPTPEVRVRSRAKTPRDVAQAQVRGARLLQQRAGRRGGGARREPVAARAERHGARAERRARARARRGLVELHALTPQRALGETLAAGFRRIFIFHEFARRGGGERRERAPGLLRAGEGAPRQPRALVRVRVQDLLRAAQRQGARLAFGHDRGDQAQQRRGVCRRGARRCHEAFGEANHRGGGERRAPGENRGERDVLGDGERHLRLREFAVGFVRAGEHLRGVLKRVADARAHIAQRRKRGRVFFLFGLFGDETLRRLSRDGVRRNRKRVVPAVVRRRLGGGAAARVVRGRSAARVSGGGRVHGVSARVCVSRGGATPRVRQPVFAVGSVQVALDVREQRAQRAAKRGVEAVHAGDGARARARRRRRRRSTRRKTSRRRRFEHERCRFSAFRRSR